MTRDLFMFTTSEEIYMQRALELAQTAKDNNEVPIGAVLILNNEIIGEGFNSPITHCDPTSHAEIIALRNGAKKINKYRLLNTTLYVTLEPCIMCVGAIIHSRVERVVYAASDSKAGALSCGFKFTDSINHHVQFDGGLLADESASLLKEFFRERR
jgi:tRNA(adenine34) deaminase